jgi:hypothetical protein
MSEDCVVSRFSFLYYLCNCYSTYVLYSLVEIRAECPLCLNLLGAPYSVTDTVYLCVEAQIWEDQFIGKVVILF